MFSHMQEALTIAGWLAAVVFLLAALADGRGYRMVRGLLAALAWTIDTVRDLKARRHARAEARTVVSGAGATSTAGTSTASKAANKSTESKAANKSTENEAAERAPHKRAKDSAGARLSAVRRRVTSAAATRRTGASTRAGDTPAQATGSD